MAIAFDSSSSNSGGSAVWSHTCTGSNQILFVLFAPTVGDTITAATYAGVNMTLLTSFSSGARVSNLYYLIAPTTGSNSIQFSLSLGNFAYGSSSSYTGVDQVSPIDANNTNTTSAGTTQSTSLTTIADNCWVIESSGSNAGSSLSAGTGTTIRGTAGRPFNLFDNNAAKTPAGSVTLQTTTTGSDLTYTIMASFKPSSPANTNFFLLF